MNTSTTSVGSLHRVGLFILAALASVGGFWGYQVYLKRQSSVDAQAPHGPIKKTHVYALGRLEPAGTIVQLAPKSGNEGTIVETLRVREGDDVTAGVTLAVLDNHARRVAALKEAESRRDAAQARLEQILAGSKQGDIEAQEAAVKLVEEQIKVAQRDLQRAKELAEKKAISSELLDQRQWDVDRLEIELRRAAGLLVSLKEIRDVDVRVAQMDVAAAAAAVTRAQADAEASELKAPMDGRILRIHTHPGERISEKGILELGNVRRMQAVAEVFEADVALLEPGMSASIRIDASGKELSGRVSEIGQLVARKIVLTNDPVSDTDARVIEVRIDIHPDQIDRVERLANSRIEVRIALQNAAQHSRDKLQDSIRTARDE